MRTQAKKGLLGAGAVFMVLAAIYCGLAILQAASLFTGERALRNVHFWGTLMCMALFSSGVFAVLARRVGRRTDPGGRNAA